MRAELTPANFPRTLRAVPAQSGKEKIFAELKGQKPEAIYPLLVNTLEPLFYFSSGAGDNLRAIRDLMKSTAGESGSADLAAIESEIAKLDTEIDERVYELCGVTEDEIKLVEKTAD